VGPPLRASMEATRRRSRLAQRDFAVAAAWLKDHPLPSPAELRHPNEYSEQLALATIRVHLALGNHLQAAELILPLEEAARQGGRTNALIEILVLKALASDRAGVGDALREALALGLPEGYTRVFLDEGEPLLTALTDLLAADPSGQEVQAARRLLPPSRQAEEPPQVPVPAILTGRELEILACMAEGLGNAEIGRLLFISTGTVKAHTAAIYRKLDVLNRAAAVSRAKDLGLI